jgi:guanylate kinase
MDGKQYHFVKRDIMEADIADNKYLEYGEFQEHLYGTKLDSIRAIIRSGRMCVVDCNPQVFYFDSRFLLSEKKFQSTLTQDFSIF